MRSQLEKAETLLQLHTNGNLLVLPNIWNPIGARILAAKGYPAVATASAALSASLGYVDGERIQRSTLIEFIGRIARSVDVPVTADIEAGYGECLDDLKETVRQVIESGVVGVNLEDSLREGGRLRPVTDQCQRISAARQVADELGVRLVINGRIDCFLSASFPDKAAAMEETVARAAAYSEAGADCIYPIGPGDEETVRALRDRIPYPINILGSPAAASLGVLRGLGVNRVSFGPYAFRSCLQKFVEIVEGLRAQGDYTGFGKPLSGAEVGQYLRDEDEQH
jgi:2-methylisocitrate lyase-like PEP mutase family enzyme